MPTLQTVQTNAKQNFAKNLFKVASPKQNIMIKSKKPKSTTKSDLGFLLGGVNDIEFERFFFEGEFLYYSAV